MRRVDLRATLLGVNRIKIALVASLLVNLLGLLAVAVYVQHAGMHATEVKLGLASDPTPDYPALAHQRFDGLPGAKVVVFGDSQVQDGPFGEIVGESARRGIGGMTIAQATAWVQQVIYPQTTTLVVELGTNDELQSHTAAQERRDYEALVGKARAIKPGLRLIFVSVPPTIGRRAQSAQVNAQLRAVCDAEHVALVDIGPLVAPAGELEPKYTLDGTHLNGAAFGRIGPSLRRAVDQLAG